MDGELIQQLREQADEIAKEGHAGWGNTMLLAAERIEALKAERDKLRRIGKALVYHDERGQGIGWHEAMVALVDYLQKSVNG